MSPEELLNLPKDTRVWVSDDGKLWLRRYLDHCERSIVDKDVICAVVYPMGCDSWTAQNYKGKGMDPRMTTWILWRLDEEGE